MHMGFFLGKIFLDSTAVLPRLESSTWVQVNEFGGEIHRLLLLLLLFLNVLPGIWDVRRGADWINAVLKGRCRKMRIPLLIWILHSVNLTKSLDNTKIPRHRRSSPVSRLCPVGCASCSALNGCLSCKPRLFFHLELDGMRQRSACLSSCPRGHYGKRSPHISICARCKEDCAFCFSENFCTRCHPGNFLFRGKCGHSCPKGLTANTALRECTECPIGCEVCVTRNVCVRCRADLYFLHGRCHLTCPSGSEPDAQLMQCIPQVHSEVGEWTEWGPCIRKRSMRAYRREEETRTQQVLQSQSVYGDRCPRVSEIRKCVINKRHSPSGS